MYRRQERKLEEYVLIKIYCEYSCGNCIGDFVSIFYTHTVVGGVVNCMGVIYGVTLPVLKYEIEDFFFARLGTGRTHRCSLRHNVCRHATTRLRMYAILKYFGVKCICVGIFGLIFYRHSVVGNNTYSTYTKMGVGK